MRDVYIRVKSKIKLISFFEIQKFLSNVEWIINAFNLMLNLAEVITTTYYF